MSKASSTLNALMTQKGWGVKELAENARLPLSTTSGLVDGSLPIDQHAAKKLSLAFGDTTKPEDWIDLQKQDSPSYYDPMYMDFDEFKTLMEQTRNSLERMNVAQNHMHWQTGSEEFLANLAALRNELDEAIHGWVASHCG